MQNMTCHSQGCGNCISSSCSTRSIRGDIRKRTYLMKMIKKVSVGQALFVVLVFIILLDMPLLIQAAKKKKNPKCSVCKDIAENFKEGLQKTKKSGHGGGNTNWEERALKSYPKSEVRLVEIMDDYLCKGDSKECHYMREEYEEYIENFWFHKFAHDEAADFFTWFCIDEIKACCKENTFGPDCKPCPGDPKRPCFGNGNCDGESTRAGTGECSCHSGYQGDLCDQCTDGHFEFEKNDTHVTCKICHISCKNTCWEDGPKGCDECKEGWLQSEEEGCKDINECQAETTPCNNEQYCVNTAGSYSCFSCDKSCIGCTGGGDGKCLACNEGFEKEGNHCKDVDECVADANLCTEENEHCVNEPGTYACKCKEGFQRNSEEKCVEIPKEISQDDEEEEEEDEDDLSDMKDEL